MIPCQYLSWLDPSLYWTRCWFIVNWSKIHCNLNQNAMICIRECRRCLGISVLKSIALGSICFSDFRWWTFPGCLLFSALESLQHWWCYFGFPILSMRKYIRSRADIFFVIVVIWSILSMSFRLLLYYWENHRVVLYPHPIPFSTDMTTSSNFRVTGPLCRDPGEFPSQRPVTWSLEVFFDLCLNKRLSKQSWGWWFETPPHPLRRHSN